MLPMLIKSFFNALILFADTTQLGKLFETSTNMLCLTSVKLVLLHCDTFRRLSYKFLSCLLLSVCNVVSITLRCHSTSSVKALARNWKARLVNENSLSDGTANGSTVLYDCCASLSVCVAVSMVGVAVIVAAVVVLLIGVIIIVIIVVCRRSQ